MLVYLVIALYLTAALLALLYPRVALLLFWPLVLCYPTWLLYRRFPLNIGYDDIFLVSLGIGSLIRSTGKLQVKWPLIAACLFVVLAVLGDFSSIAMGDALNPAEVLKRFLKSTGLVLLVFSMSSMITTSEQIKRMTYMLLFGAMLGAILVVYYSIYPYASNPFQIPYWAAGRGAWQVHVVGPFSSHDRAGGVLGFAVLIGYFLIRFGKGWYKRWFLVSVTVILFLGALVCGSRSGWLFILSAVMLSSLFSKQKILGLVLISFGILLILISLAKVEYFGSRFERTITAAKTMEMQALTHGRYLHWKQELSNPNIRWLAFGEGFTIEETHPHSNYIAMLKNMGMIGILFWIVYYKRVFGKSYWLMKYDPNPAMAALCKGIFWAYIGYFVLFITGTPLMWPPVRYTNFFLMTLIHLRYRQLETEQQYIFEDELYDEDQPVIAELAY